MQYYLREQLKKRDETAVSQIGKQTNNPSMKWIYRLFHGVHVLKIKDEDSLKTGVLNVNAVLKKIIRLFGEQACRIYNISLESQEGASLKKHRAVSSQVFFRNSDRHHKLTDEFQKNKQK